MPSKVIARLSGPFLFAMLLAAITLSASNILAFSLQDYEGGVQLGQWQGSLEGGYQFEDETSSSPGSSFSLTRDRFDELMKIRNDGIYYIDPRLLTGDAGFDLDLFQEQDRYSHGPSSSFNGLLWGYNLSTTLFPQWPENATFYANQNQNVSNSTFGGRTQIDNSNIGLLAQVLEDSVLKDHGLYYFNSRLSAREETFDESTTELGQTFRIDEQREVVDYTADKGFQTADLGLRYQFDNERDTGTSKLAFQTQNIGLSYDLDFGPNLNRAWSSDVDYYSRTGSGGAQEYLSVNEMLNIAHYENLSTSYLYQLQYNNNQQQGATTYQFGLFQLQHNLFENLNETLSLGGIYQTFSGGDITAYWIGGAGGYNHALPWSGTFFLNISGQYEIQDNSLSSSQIPVTDEPHTAPSSLGTNIGFFLNNNFVLTATIVMVDNAHGGRIPTVLNVDYDVLQIGNQTEIIPLPTSLIIHPGDPLLVSYSYQVPASARFSTTTKTVNVGVTFPWIDASYSYQAIDQNLLSGVGAQYLVSQTTNTVNIGVHHDWESFAGLANAMYQTLDSTDISYTMVDFSQNVTYRPGWDTVLSLSGAESFADYTMPKLRTRNYALLFNGDRSLGGGGTMSVFASLRDLEDSRIPTQKTIETGLRIRYNLGKLQFAPSITWDKQTWGTTNSSDLLLEIRVIRLFD